MVLRILCSSCTRDIYEINLFPALYICFPKKQNQPVELAFKFCSLKIINCELCKTKKEEREKEKKELVVGDAK